MLKETLERFREKKLGQLDFCGNDDHECECTVKEEEIKQFITEEIKLAFQAGKDSMREEILNKLPERKSENKKKKDQEEWINIPRIQRAVGFNSCLSQVKDIIKNV